MPLYWPNGYFRPEIDLYAVGPNGDCTPCKGQIDSASDWVVLDLRVAVRLGLSPPFSQVVSVSGIAGAAQRPSRCRLTGPCRLSAGMTPGFFLKLRVS